MKAFHSPLEVFRRLRFRRELLLADVAGHLVSVLSGKVLPDDGFPTRVVARQLFGVRIRFLVFQVLLALLKMGMQQLIYFLFKCFVYCTG